MIVRSIAFYGLTFVISLAAGAAAWQYTHVLAFLFIVGVLLFWFLSFFAPDAPEQR